MDNSITHTEYFPGVYHISDGLGVQFTLIVSRAGAILFDAGYGIKDPRPYLKNLLKKHRFSLHDLSVVISHAHHDHLAGARWFNAFHIHWKDFPLIDVYTERNILERVLVRAMEQGLIPPGFDKEAFFLTRYRRRARIRLPIQPDIEILHIPGHTPGSLVVYVREHKVLLSADNWNPTTWLFFPEALSVHEYAANMRKLLSLDFDYVLCSHSKDLIPGDRIRNYIRGLSAETFAQAEPAETPYPEIKTMRCRPEPETDFIFRAFS